MSILASTFAAEAMSDRRPLFFAGTIGFFFVFRACFTFLFFQADPVFGSAITIGLDLAILFGVVFYTVQPRGTGRCSLKIEQPLRWIFAFLALSLASVAWTGAQSPLVAIAYWVGMAAEVLIILLLVRGENPERYAVGLMKGAMWGAAALALVAWCSPVTADLRLGDVTFLHPNTLGLEFALATLVGQYLSSRDPQWRWLTIALGITLLRTLSKTSIIAFIVAEVWYLLQNRATTRRVKLQIAAVSLLTVVCFWGLLSTYIDTYTNTGSGDQIETLTGRTVLWTVAFSMGQEKPWFGHGIYSFRALIPAVGDFEPVHAHNEFLQQFFEFGLVGVFVLGMIYWSLFRQARRTPPSDLRTLSLAILLFALVRGLTDTTNFGLSYPLWLLNTLSICLARPMSIEVE